LIGNVVAEILERAGNAIVSPTAVLACHADDQFRDLATNGGPSRVGSVFGTIELASN
jgi:hypothetical protein